LSVASRSRSSIEDKTKVLVIMFGDTVGATAFAERVGELESERRRVARQRLIREIVEEKGAGGLIKCLGDGFMAAFHDPSTAVERAIAIQRKIFSSDLGGLRIGLHMGQVALTELHDEDVNGRHVNRASRICTKAKEGQILVSESVYDNARGWIDEATSSLIGWHPHGPHLLKGIEDRIEIFEALYEGHPTPCTLTQISPVRRSPVITVPAIDVRRQFSRYAYLAESGGCDSLSAIVLDDSLVTIGRGMDNQFVINEPQVSRLHAVIAYIGRHWLLVDHDSRNGIEVNHSSVRQHLLRDGDEIRIGSRQFVFRFDQNSPQYRPYALYPMANSARAAAARQGANPIMGEILETVFEECPSTVGETCSIASGMGITCHDGEGRGATYMFSSMEPLIVGGDGSADLRLRDGHIRPSHLELRSTTVAVEAQAVEGAPRPRVNGRECGSALLKPGDTVAIGQSELVVHLPLYNLHLK
jgi:class 3 adenylate cyclase